MTWQQIASLAAAAVVGLWPQLKVPRLGGPTYQQAIANLALVRKRLVDTGVLGDDQKDAIDKLTLALVEGSDK
jgi:hypothetical protein